MKRLIQMIAALFTVSRLFAAEAPALDAPLPPMDAVVQRVIDQANQEKGDEQTFKQHYSYTRARITDTLNSDGEVTSHTEKTSDRSPLDPPRPKKHPAKPASKDPQDSQFDKKDFVLTHDLVDRFDLTMVGREMIRGRPALHITFKPKNGHLPENSLKERFINHAAGDLWIDEQDYAVAKADVHLIQQVNVFGGVAGAIYKFHFTLDRAPAEAGLWYILNMNWHLEAREVLFSRYQDYHELWSNVHKVL